MPADCAGLLISSVPEHPERAPRASTLDTSATATMLHQHAFADVGTMDQHSSPSDSAAGGHWRRRRRSVMSQPRPPSLLHPPKVPAAGCGLRVGGETRTRAGVLSFC